MKSVNIIGKIIPEMVTQATLVMTDNLMFLQFQGEEVQEGPSFPRASIHASKIQSGSICFFTQGYSAVVLQ